MPPQLRKAALFVISHPEDVALASMRQFARLARVSHSTMLRLATWLGYENYAMFRREYATDLRRGRSGDESPMLNASPSRQYSAFLDEEPSPSGINSRDRSLSNAARVLSDARRVFAAGTDSELLLPAILQGF